MPEQRPGLLRHFLTTQFHCGLFYATPYQRYRYRTINAAALILSAIAPLVFTLAEQYLS